MNRASFFFAICLLGPCPAHAAVERIVETFNNGFDNSGWRVTGDGTFDSIGYSVVNNPGPDERLLDSLERTVNDSGSFVSRAEFRDLDFGEIGPGAPIDAAGSLLMHHQLGPRGNHFVRLVVDEVDSADDSIWGVGVSAGSSNVLSTIPRTNHLMLELAYDEDTRSATYKYIDLVSDVVLFESTLPYQGRFSSSHDLVFWFVAEEPGKANAIFDHYELIPAPDVTGDFDGDGLLDTADIDLLTEEVQAATHDLFFDLNNDALVDNLDRIIWVHDLKNTFFGDANLNGEFNSADLVNVFQSAEYEDNVPLNSTWLTGDWNGDAEFTSNDLVVAFQDGGYETGPRPVANAVPEPTAAMLMLIGLLAVARRCVLSCGTRFERTV